MRFFLLCVAALFATCVQSQTDSLHADCDKAINLNLFKKHHQAAPSGYGRRLEVSGKGKNNARSIEQEHNTVWYTFTIPSDGKLSFDLIPDEVKDDYDFMLYKKEGEVFCADLSEKKLNPIRANISRNNTKLESKTGLNDKARYDFNPPGVNDAFSKSLDVFAGEVYYLLVDNVYPNGKGHTLVFHFPFTLQGKVVDSASLAPLSAKVTLIDLRKGDTLASAQSNTETGMFDLPIESADTIRWQLSFQSSGYFFEYIILTQNSLPGMVQKPRTQRMRKIEVNKTFVLKDINFAPSSDVILPISYPALKELLNLMQQNPLLKISIEGHTNGVGSKDKGEKHHLELSSARAKAVSKFLTDNGINADRIGTVGYGYSKMLFPNASSVQQMNANMRVEIKIISY